MAVISRDEHLKTMVYMVGAALDSIAEIRPENGRRSLNELRISNHIMQGVLRGSETTVGGLSQTLDLPLSTVSKTVKRLIRDGWLDAQPDPEDYRRKPLFYTPESVESARIWAEILEAKRRAIIESGLPIGTYYTVK